MDLNRILRAESRILDVGAPGPELATGLTSQGYQHYLGLVAPSSLPQVRERADGLDHRFHALTSPSQVMRSSADLLILRRPFGRMLWSLRELRHLQYIAVETGSRSPSVEMYAAQMVGRLTRRITPRGTLTLSDRRFDVLEVETRRPLRPRLYLSEVWGVSGLIRRLNDEGLRYAALRWFETLPDLQPGEDLDLLVADEDLEAVRSMLSEEPGTIPVDLYSETGLPGADYQGAAYYVPEMARQILARVVRHESGCSVPSPRDHLLSLAYHAVYHKGERSGLPSADADGFVDPDHDYGSALQGLAERLGTPLPGSLEGIDDYLAQEGWRPPPDALRRLSGSNPWITRRFNANLPRPSDLPEVSVFLVRERALDFVGIEEIRAVLEAVGFEVLLARQLDGQARQRCADLTRGGNWGGGPFPVSGGGPALAMVAVHHGPREPDSTVREQYPRLTNDDVLLAKVRIRGVIGTRVTPSGIFNPVHSSDDELEAWEYVEAAIPDEVAEVRAAVDARRAAYRTEVPVVRELSRGRRAKVEVVQTSDGLAVRKTFAAGATRYMERELRALRELGPRIDAVPELLETGPNWFTCPYYDNTLGDLDRPRGGRLLPLRVVREMVAVLRSIHELGFDLIDVKPQNFLQDRRDGLKIVDFEFLYSYPGTPPDFAASHSFLGVPDDFVGDVPVSAMSYEWRWRRFTGLSLDGLLSAAPWRQHLERATYSARLVTIGPDSRARRLVRLCRSGLRGSRASLARRYWRWARRRAFASSKTPLSAEQERPGQELTAARHQGAQ